MSIEITFSRNTRLLTLVYKPPGKSSESIVMEAHSGGWDAHNPLPKGKWLITENPSGDRSYFGLFYVDKNINDQFRDTGKWRDGIRFGFHMVIGSHGCIMTKPARGQSPIDAHNQWKRIQELVRTKRPRKLHTYQNNEIPHKRDNTKYNVSSYGNLTVKD